MANILITGAAGRIGTRVSQHLSGRHALTLVDLSFEGFPSHLMENETIIQTDLTVQSNWEGLLEGIDYLIQLAADPSPEAEFYGSLLELNYQLPYNLFNEALHSPSLKRIIFASSIHAVDAYPEDVQVRVEAVPRPNDLYGVSKVYLESLASFYAYVHGIQSIGIRIGHYTQEETELPEKMNRRDLSTYLSAKDFNQLIDCCLAAPLDKKCPFLLVNGLSNNTFNRLNLEHAKNKLGYQPSDNAFVRKQMDEKPKTN